MAILVYSMDALYPQNKQENKMSCFDLMTLAGGTCLKVPRPFVSFLSLGDFCHKPQLLVGSLVWIGLGWLVG